MDAQGNNVLKGISFSAPQKQYSLEGDKVEVRLSAPETNGLKIDKVYTFTKGSYLVNVRFDITNSKGQPVNLSADYRIVRDHSEPEGQGYFTRSYVGPVVYSPEGGFQKSASLIWTTMPNPANPKPNTSAKPRPAGSV